MNTQSLSHLIGEINTFWFGSSSTADYGQDRAAWFVKNPAFDAEIKARFAGALQAAAVGELDAMAASPEGAVALVVTLDQFPRNLYRDDPRAFATDAKALTLAKDVIAQGFDQEVMKVMRKFLYLPFEHSEDLGDQDRSIELFEALGDADALDWAVKHRDIIQRFGRFPHRNAVLGRASTSEEKEFLTQPGSSF